VQVVRNGWRRAGILLLFVCAAVVITATASTSSARFVANTDNDNNFWEAANLELEVDGAQNLFLEGSGLYPGLMVENCFVVTYFGTIDGVDIRVHSQGQGGSLGRFFELTIQTGSGTASDCSDFEAGGQPAFSGTLSTFSARHGSFESGLLLAADMADGDQITVRASGALRNDNAAQGLSGRFVAVVEARP